MKISGSKFQNAVTTSFEALWTIPLDRNACLSDFSIVGAMGDISVASVVSMAGYCHWDFMLNPDVLPPRKNLWVKLGKERSRRL